MVGAALGEPGSDLVSTSRCPPPKPAHHPALLVFAAQVIVNGVPRHAVEIVAGVNKYRFGESLELVEQEWIASEINGFLEERRGRAPRLEDMGDADAPQLYDDTDVRAQTMVCCAQAISIGGLGRPERLAGVRCSSRALHVRS